MIRKPPVTVRETLELLRLYRPEAGLAPLFQAATGSEWDTRQIYYAVHARPPDKLADVLNENDPTFNIFNAAMTSDEFRRNHVPRLLRAYPEKRRLFHVGIPRSAGRHLASHMSARHATLDTRMGEPGAGDDATFLLALKHFALEVGHVDTVFVTGARLPLYDGWNVARHDDRIVAVLRDPVARVLSVVNRTLARILSAAAPAEPEVVAWRDLLGVLDPGSERSREEVIRLGHRLLRETAVAGRNVACDCLGDGSHEQALERIAVLGVEVVDFAAYGRWWLSEFGSPAPQPVDGSALLDRSPRYLAPGDLSAEAMDAVLAATDQDRRLHADLLRACAAKGSASAIGAELVRSRATTAVEPPAPTPPEVISPEPSAAALVAPPPAAEPQPPLAPADLMKCFESIGENCELGLVQRRCGAEPLGLLRFASAPYDKLMPALRARFEGMGQADRIEIQISGNGREYMVLDRTFGFLYHAWVSVGEKSPEEIAAREVRRVPFLIRKLVEDFAAGEKIFVFHGMDPLTRGQALDMAEALQAYGRNVLLWVELADAEHAPGRVEQIAPGLIKGYIDRFAPGENAHDLSLNCWIDLCRGAKALAGL